MMENIPFLISPEEIYTLMKEVTKEEIHKAIWDLAPDKALGPNSFTISNLISSE